LLALGVVVGGAAIAAAACGGPCTAGASHCVDDGTIEACGAPGGDVPLRGNYARNEWNRQACSMENPFCVSLSSGGADCVATKDRTPACDGVSQGMLVCWSFVPSLCEDGFVKEGTMGVCMPSLGPAGDGGSTEANGLDAGDAGID
jgi:hypothetical protein